MFLRRIPYQSVRRRRIRHWVLLLLRAAAIALIVAAFARPFFPQGALAAAVGGGAREVVILLDQSASMGYGDHWARAQEAARDGGRAASAPTTGRRSCCSRRNAEENMRATSDRTRARSGHRRGEGRVGRDALRPGAEAGRKHPEPLVAQAARGGADQRFPEERLERRRGRALPRGHDAHARCRSRRRTPRTSSVPSVTFARATFSGQERITVTAGLEQQGRRAGRRTCPSR